MTGPVVAPFGSWRSPITTDLIVGDTIGLSAVAWDGETIYWTEARPAEGGRVVLVRRDPGGSVADVTPAPYNVRSRVHEYGGGSFTIAAGVVYFVNFADQRIYRQRPGEAPTAVTADGPWRFADIVVDTTHDRLICIREDHGGAGEPTNALVAVLSLSATGGSATGGSATGGSATGGSATGGSATGGSATGGSGRAASAGEVLADGHDFFASPCLAPDGQRLAWLSWDHPNMPWDGTTLWCAGLDAAGRPCGIERIAGGPAESVFQPAWSAAGQLHYVSDRDDGWWTLYRAGAAASLCAMAAEFGLPQWVFGMATYGFAGDGRIVASYTQDGLSHLGTIGDARLVPLETPYTDISGPKACGNQVVFIGASATRPTAVVRLDLATGATQEIKASTTVALDPGDLSTPRPMAFPTTDDATAHGFYYPPANRAFTGPEGAAPPLMVRGHGGPTGATSAAFSLSLQYWTSRGFAVLDMNYRGSTGYGRAYREALYGVWGEADVDDCVAGALTLADQGLADRARLAIRGGSAGGYTTLAALTFRDVFAAGASHYGIGDLMALARETHKFESRYLDRLIGPLPAAVDLYHRRSPLNYPERLDCPVIFLQGLDDKVVPPNQAETMVAALKAKGVPVAYLAFAGEGHGFRKAENVKRALEAELYFYGRVFGFRPADDLAPVEIANLAAG